MTLRELLGRFHGMRAVVVGDLMLDEYIFGRAARISPEAPVMVIRQTSTDRLPGGAANVALNLRALGAHTEIVGVVGCDESGDLLRASLERQGLSSGHLVADPARPTTRKTRVLADHAHQVLRIDHESEMEVTSDVESQLVEQAESLLAACDVLVLSDYLKGALSQGVSKCLLAAAHARGVKVVVNPKPRSLANYKGADLVSLNRSEAADALGLWAGLPDSEAQQAAATLRDRYGFEHVLVTLGEGGMAAQGKEAVRVSAPKVEVYDTAGAGDTVVATVALGLASAGFCKEVFELASQTAACVVQHVGVATPSAADLAAIQG